MTAKKPTVDDFLTDLEHPRIEDIRKIRSTLIIGDGELRERIKWNAPSFGYEGNDRVTFRIQPGDRFEVVLHRGVHKRNDPFTFDDSDRLITWATNDRGVTVVASPLTPDDETQLVTPMSSEGPSSSQSQPVPAEACLGARREGVTR